MATEQFKTLQADEEFRATAAAYLVIRLEASTSSRTVIVDALLNGQVIASASASDSYVQGAFSTPVNSLTIPIPAGASVAWKLRAGQPNQVRATLI